MKNNKIVKKLFAGVMAVSLCLGSTLAVAAAPGDGDEKSKTVSLTKQLNVADGVTLPDTTFAFHFEQDFDTEGAATQPVGIEDKTLVFKEADKETSKRDAKAGTIVKETKNLIEGIEWPAAGKYVYTVSEVKGGTEEKITTNDVEGTMIYDGQTYIMEVGVKNGANGPEVDNVVVKKDPADTKKTDGTPTGGEEGSSTNNDDENTNGTGNAFRFENTYKKQTGEKPDKPVEPGDPDNTASALKITKAVVAAEGGNLDDVSLTQQYPFTLTLNYPATATDEEKGETIAVGIYNEAKTCQRVVKITPGTPVDFALADKEYLAVKSLPAGTTYDLEEKGTNNFTGIIATITNGVKAGETRGELSAAVSITRGVVGEKADANASDVTNEYDSQSATPTGILVNNLPYIAIILVAIVGCAVIVAGRKRRAN